MALTDNLVSYWKLDESSGNATDIVGSNTLTNNNTATYSAGKINNGVNLASASSQSLSASDSASLSLTGDFTFSFWVKLASNPSSGQEFNLITKYLPTGNQRSYQVLYSEDSGNYNISLNINADGASASTNVSWLSVNLGTGTWKHIVIKYTASTHTSEAYVNGSSLGTKDSVRTSIFDSTAPFVLGSTNAGGSYLNGSLDEMGIWSRPLTSDEVTELYNSDNGIQYPFSLDVSAPTLSITVTLNAPTLVLENPLSVSAPTLGITATLNAPTLNFIDPISVAPPTLEMTLTMLSPSKIKVGLWATENKNTSTWTEDTKNTSVWIEIDKSN